LPAQVRIGAILYMILLMQSGCVGLWGDDDVQGYNCAVGPATLIQPLDVPSKETTSKVKIFMLRGLVNTYSLGLDRLAGEMENLNLDPVLIDWPEWEGAAQEIVLNYESHPDDSEFIFIGHSYGSDDAVNVSRYFAKYNVPIKLLFLLDSSAPQGIPSNVEKCIHYYIPTIAGDLLPFIFAGNPVTLDPGNKKTILINEVYDVQNFGEGVGCANHFSIDVNIEAHNLIIDEVLKIVKSGKP
jgi:hypothetical protein